jgi:hypothetical protein
LDIQLLQLGLASPEELGAGEPEDPERDRQQLFQEERVYVISLAEKLRRLFDYHYPSVKDVRTQSVWAAGELLEFGGNFNKYITAKGLQKQEGILFRHLLRLVLLAAEFAKLSPADAEEEEWCNEMADIADRLTDACRQVDPLSTDEALHQDS